MLAWYLLKAGDRDEGEAAFARLRAERVGDPQIVSTLANARMDSGDGQGALEAYDEALDLAKSTGDYDWIGQLRGERQYCRFEHGLPPDEDDRLAERANPAYLKTRSMLRSRAGRRWPTTLTIQMPIAERSRPACASCEARPAASRP